MAEALQVHHVEQRIDPFGAFGCSHLADFQAIGDVLANRHVGEQGIVLEYHADAAFFNRQVGDVIVAEQHAAAVVGKFQPGNQPQRGGLAAAGRPQQHQRFAGMDFKVDRLQRGCAAAEGLGALKQSDGKRRVHRRTRVRVVWVAHCMATSSGTIIKRKIRV